MSEIDLLVYLMDEAFGALLAGEDRWNWEIHEGIDPLAAP